MLALLGAIFGGVLRLAPEVLKLFTAKRDQDHEYRMRSLDFEQAKALRELDMKRLDVEAQMTLDAKGLEALVSGIEAQGKLTGVRWLDGLSQSVRPFLTYWWMGLYTVVKIATISVMWGTSDGWAQAFLVIWTEADMGILGGIINFWFLDRVIRKRA